MEEEDENVTFFLNRAGELVLVVGTRAEVETSSFYGYIAEKTASFSTRSNTNYTLDLLNQEGEVVEYDVTATFADKYDGTEDSTLTQWTTDIAKGNVVKVTLDEDGDIDKVEKLTAVNFAVGGTSPVVDTEIEVDDTYAAGYRLQNDAIVFLTEGETEVEDYTVMTWAEAADEFDTVEAGTLLVNSSDRVVVMIVDTTDAETADPETLRGLVTKVRTIETNKEWEITVEIEGSKQTFVTNTDDYTTLNVAEDNVVSITVVEDEITAATVLSSSDIKVGRINRADATIEVLDGSGNVTATYELVANGVVYDSTDSYEDIRLRDLAAGDTVNVHTVEGSTRFVDYVVKK